MMVTANGRLHPVALTVAGSDSGGGAGVQADLRAFAYFGIFGTTVLTAVTAQNPVEVRLVHDVPDNVIAAQLATVLDAFTVGAAKTGMLARSSTVATVAACFRQHPELPLVVDPVMVATSGAKLLEPDAVNTLVSDLLPLATVITPNLPEAEILAGRELKCPCDCHKAAAELARRYTCTIVLKGGHDTGDNAEDVVSDGTVTRILCTPRIKTRTNHGTGCTLSAAIAACIAADVPLTEAIVKAKAYVLESTRTAVRVGSHTWSMGPVTSLPLDCITTRVL